MIRQLVTLLVRNDPAGSGEFGAPRGDRAHTAIDYECVIGQPVLSPVAGTVTKHGWAYRGEDWRIIDVTDAAGFVHRLFYVAPTVEVGTPVHEGTPIGVAQDITERYPGTKMLPHIHYQIEDVDGEIVNPHLFYQAGEARS